MYCIYAVHEWLQILKSLPFAFKHRVRALLGLGMLVSRSLPAQLELASHDHIAHLLVSVAMINLCNV